MRRIDKYKTAEEAEEAFCNFCKLYSSPIVLGKSVCFGCPYKAYNTEISCRFSWAFDEEKEYE